MNERSCDIIADLLVDFSDGELSVADRERVESHLAGCPVCRGQVERLGHSLELARSVWAESAAEASRCATALGRRPPPRRETRFRLAAVAAACAIVVLVGLGLWLLVGGSREVASRQQPELTGRGGSRDVAEPIAAAPSDAADIGEILARKTRAARLAAAARLLATEPSLKAYQIEAERYLAQAYPESASHQPSDRQGTVPLSKESKL